MQRTYTTNSVQETILLGASLGKYVRGGEVIELNSDVGGGKTTLTKGIASGMGITDLIQSPTFMISREYAASSGLELHHYDFYRLGDAGIMSAELAESIADKKVITIVEWAGIIESTLPETKITIKLRALSDSSRECTVIVPSGLDYIYEPLGKVAL